MEAASPSTSAAPFDVFINHRGPDLKNTVASPIYHWLRDKGLRVFLDKQEFKPGQELLPTIKDAIRTSSAHVAIFSRTYAESPWCLDELCLMLETRATIIIVFYDVKPWELRWIEKGVYAQAFAQHVEKGRFESQRLQDWKAALTTVSNRDGLELNGPRFNGDQGQLFKAIVDAAVQAVKKVPLNVVEHPVGLNETVAEFENFMLKSWQNGKVNIFGIVGMAGSGKTTLAKELYDRKRSSFSGSSFLCDVNSGNKLLEALQSRLLEDLLTIKTKFDNTSLGQSTLKRRLSSCKSRKFLIVLDGIDDKDQLDALLVKDALGPDSLIIITSRDKSVLNLSRVSLHYKMKPLDPKHARELFCWNAFRRRDPIDEFEEDIVEESLRNCSGLPSCLKDTGEFFHSTYADDYWNGESEICSQVRSRMVDDWKGELEKFFLAKSQTVRYVYDALWKEEQQIFLDIACFFAGEERTLAIRIWDESRWNCLRCLRTLESKFIVELEGEGCVRVKMHDRFRGLGREIANTESPRRIWHADQGREIVKRWKNGMEIGGIMAATKSHESEHKCSSSFPPPFEEISQMNKTCVGLKLLVINGDCFKSQFSKLSSELVWLRWYNYPHKSIPSWLHLKNLRVLEIDGQDIQELWQDEAPLQLRELKIRCRDSSEEIPQSIGSLTYLEKIVLDCGESTCAHHIFPEAFCSLESLRHLEFHCQSVASLPDSLGNLSNLEHIDCSRCGELRTIPSSFCELPRLKYLNLLHCKNLKIQLDILRSLTARQHFRFEGRDQIQVQHIEITSDQSSLMKTLDSVGTSLTQEIPSNFGKSNNSQVLRIANLPLQASPSSVRNVQRRLVAKGSTVNAKRLNG